MFASLPMYDRPENRGAHDALWALIRDGLRQRGISAPESLDRDTDHVEGWGRADLVLGQICNLPYRALFRGRVTVIGTADYSLEGVPPGFYYSEFVTRTDDPARGLGDCDGYRLAYNDALSNSGWNAVHDAARDLGIGLNPVVRTGAHAASLAAVAQGDADLAAIDAISWWRLAQTDPNARRVRVVGRSGVSPGMTFITAPGRDPDRYFEAISTAIADLPEAHRHQLGLRGIVALPPEAFDLPLPPEPVARAG